MSSTSAAGIGAVSPVIGVTPLVDYKLKSLWMLPGYMDAITRAGGIPVMLPLHLDKPQLMHMLDRVDAIVFTGGPDLGPDMMASIATGMRRVESSANGALAAETVSSAYVTHTTSPVYGVHAVSYEGAQHCVDAGAAGRSEVLSPERDALEFALFTEALKRDMPMLGICRGMQLMNVALGGTLWNDLPTEHPSDVEHHMHNVPEDALGHTVSVVAGTPMAQMLAKLRGRRIVSKTAGMYQDSGVQFEHSMQSAHIVQLMKSDRAESLPQLLVNSYHHQAVRRLGDGLRAMAIASDGIVEAMWRPSNRCVWAVQWHPELLIARGPNIIDYFVETITSF